MWDAPVRCMTTPLTPFPNLIELARASVTRHATRPLFGERDGDTWRWITYAEWQAEVDALRGALAALGVRPGERIAVVSRNCTAWATAAYATYGVGAAFVPMYEAQRPEDWEFILRDCGATIVFGRTPQIAAALEAMRPRLPALRHVLVFEAGLDDPRSLRSLQQRGRAEPVPAYAPSTDDIAGFVYTSGTTGMPKGVMLSHGNFTSNIAATSAGFPFLPTDRTLSFLPWAHVYGQVGELHLLIAAGASTAFNTNTDHLLDDLRVVQPTILIAVPRIFNRLHASVQTQIEHRPRLVQRLFARGLAASIRKRRGERLGVWDALACWVAGLLFAAIRKKLGGHLRYAISASATLSREIAEFIDGLGIEVYEGYGLTETAPVVSMNRPGMRKLGSVGLPLENVRIDLALERGTTPGEGEIIVHGPNVMKGYYNRPDEDAHAFTPDGGLRTGDLGRLDADGYLYITGRIKEQYKLENDKYVMPAPIEEKLALSPFIRNVMLYGADHPYNVALVVIELDHVLGWAAENNLTLDPDPAQDERVRALIRDELERFGTDLRSYERPRECTLTTIDLTMENGFLTPTLKLKRREVIAKYGQALEALYDRPRAEPAKLAGPPQPSMPVAIAASPRAQDAGRQLKG